MNTWQYFCNHYFRFSSIGLSIDVSKIKGFDNMMTKIRYDPIREAMVNLENGSIANRDENRMVGHYWLRNPSIAPSSEIKTAIVELWRDLDRFVQRIHSGDIQGQNGKFKNALCIGIGGSALGPQLAYRALSRGSADKMALFFIDNTDPEGIDLVLAQLNGKLGETLVIVTSKSGETAETRNGMLEVTRAYEAAGLDFNRHAVAITCENSQLDQLAKHKDWLKRFPMWDWVGGRTSIASVVGLLPMALQGVDYKQFLDGMCSIDSLTRDFDANNPAFLLTIAWCAATDGTGRRAMVILPYKDRLSLLGNFLQQLIMESIGKKFDHFKCLVEQGLTVYGNKGSTDQHAYMQQLLEGINNAFVTFIEVLTDRDGTSMWIEKDVTTGDYLEGFLLGTRQALYENRRESVTITIDRVDAYYLGVLIGLYERTVGFYTSIIHINAYHQPGVEAGKKAANNILALQKSVLQYLRENAQQSFSAEALSNAVGKGDTEIETIFKLLEHLAANHRVKRIPSRPWQQNTYQYLN
ncbi:MAG: glucose-6-phosphate isomerase [Puniceicoccales bacterium]|jgi:glucose-6-phosphate isomerase|nr:glucose-6-phosphate isomerase [Puniceicoccales bacterium]